jgi:hypothetical protein
MQRILLLLGLVLLCVTGAWAAPTAGCHCFQDRAFDPGRPGAVDPYLLATAQNSLFAAAFGVPKKDVVLARMGGTASGDLWIAHYAAKAGGAIAADLLAGRRNAASWAELLERHGIAVASLGPYFAQVDGDAALAAAVVRTVLHTRLGAEAADLERLRFVGASPQETILAVVLGRKSGRPADDLLAEVRAGKTSWGALLHALGIPAGRLEAEIRQRLR